MDSSPAFKLEVVSLRPRITGSRIGHVTRIAEGGAPMVDFPGNPFGALTARWVGSLSRVALAAACAESRAVLLVFEDNDAAMPVIVDTVVGTGDVREPASALPASARPEPAPFPRATISTHATLALARCTGIADGKLQVEPLDEPACVLQADTVCPLRNLKDPVLLLRSGASNVVIGQLWSAATMEGSGDANAELLIKGERVRIEAGSLLSLQAGNCSLELSANGRAVLLGDQIVSRACTTNRVQGGSVLIN